MRRVIVAAAVAVVAAFAPLATAAAGPLDGPADVVVKNLQAQGYNVQVNTSSIVPLSRCTVVGIHPSNLDDSASLQDKQHTLVQVDVSCPSH
jgi:hypothetical protein